MTERKGASGRKKSNEPSLMQLVTRFGRLNVAEQFVVQEGNPNVFPMDPITKFVSVGNIHAGTDLEFLVRKGFGAVVCCTPELPRPAEDYQRLGLALYHVPVGDHPIETNNIFRHFDLAGSFIKRNVDGKKRVLIHCQAGISRSATICCAYLIREFGMSNDQAVAYVRGRRIVSPNPGFMKALNEYFRSRH
jgi:protein tyrosine phosphatase (PTP) superfamily phosphohydrolase (DUF442 family)